MQWRTSAYITLVLGLEKRQRTSWRRTLHGNGFSPGKQGILERFEQSYVHGDMLTL
jgi:hypothetical protein